MLKYYLLTIIAIILILLFVFRKTPLTSNHPKIISSANIALGIYQPQENFSGDNIDRYIKETGKKPAFAWTPTTWQNIEGDYLQFNPEMLEIYQSREIMPGITWSPSKGSIESYKDRKQATNQPEFSWKELASGKHDKYLSEFAKDAAKYKHPFLLRFMHEMDGNWYPWGYNVNGNTDPADYATTWKHIVDIFRREGATNVQFVWCISVLSPELLQKHGNTLKELYPGDNYVDWIALDGYSNAQNNWKSLEEEFKPSYEFITAFTTRPIILWEVGATEKPNDTMFRANWIREGFLTTIPEKLPRIKIASWFNSRDGSGRDYRLQSSPNSVSAWKEVVASPLYQKALIK